MLRLNLILTYGIPLDIHGGVQLYILTTIRHGISPVFIGSRNCVHSVFTVERPPALGQMSLKIVLVTTGAVFAGRHGTVNERLSFLTPTIDMK